MKEFIKKNPKIIILYSFICLLLLFCLASAVRKCVLDKQGNGTTVVSSSTIMDMIEEDETFTFVIGQTNCGACKDFNNVLRKYTGEGNKVYYVYVDNSQVLHVSTLMNIIKDKIKHELPIDKRPKELYTPTTFYVENGLIKDIYTGTLNPYNRDKYEVFKKTISGEYVKRKIMLTDLDLIEKINNQDDFTLVVGATWCGACKIFEDTIHKYVVEEKNVYYLYLDLASSEVSNLIFTKLLNEVPGDRNAITIDGEDMSIGTPLSIYVEDGIFKDTYSGYVDYDSLFYDLYIDIMNGVYKDSSYPLS